MAILFFIAFLLGLVWLIFRVNRKPVQTEPIDEKGVVRILEQDVDFYNDITHKDLKSAFLNRVIRFLGQVRFTPVGGAEVTLNDKVLIACSAYIPLFSFPEWEYRNIREVLLYDDHFDTQYSTGQNKPIMGMVGDGALKQTMLLSLRALREGFERRDGNHTAIHEFIHLIDHADGSVDGIPEALMPTALIQPWLRHIRHCIGEINEGRSGIDPYAATNEAEFFSVASEYFFEKPAFLERNHPVLYRMMKEIFIPVERR
jgi:Mlc titration factor MtfA (ptsG expression regulator)